MNPMPIVRQARFGISGRDDLDHGVLEQRKDHTAEQHMENVEVETGSGSDSDDASYRHYGSDMDVYQKKAMAEPSTSSQPSVRGKASVPSMLETGACRYIRRNPCG